MSNFNFASTHFLLKIRNHHNRNPQYQSNKMVTSVHYLIAPVFLRSPLPWRQGLFKKPNFWPLCDSEDAELA